MQRTLILGLLVAVTLLVTGTPALINMLLESDKELLSTNPLVNPKAVSLTPITIFLVALGVAGVYMLYLAGVNAKTNMKLAIKQLIVSVNLIGGSWAGLEFLFALALKP